MSTEKIAVIGAGLMGHGIAQVAAQSGFEVTLQDVENGVLDQALNQIRLNLEKGIEKGKLKPDDRDQAIKRLGTETELKKAIEGADLIIEAIPESLPLKIELFGKISRSVPEETIIATNTSSLSIGKIAAASHKPERIVGMHFFNPPFIIKLLELVWSPRTDKDVIKRAEEFARKMDREVVTVKDSPGFATSRLGVVLGLEAMRMVEQKVASPGDIDKAMEMGYRHPMGPLRLSDLVGLDTRLYIADYLFKELAKEQYYAPKILRDLVSQKKLGQKPAKVFLSGPINKFKK